jgi:hypothetical protein
LRQPDEMHRELKTQKQSYENGDIDRGDIRDV